MNNFKDIKETIEKTRTELNFLREEIRATKTKIYMLEQAAKDQLRTFLTEKFGNYVLEDLKEESKKKELNCGYPWVINGQGPRFTKKWQSNRNRDIQETCKQISINLSRACDLILDGLAETGKVEIEDGGTVIPGEQFGGYAVYRPRL